MESNSRRSRLRGAKSEVVEPPKRETARRLTYTPPEPEPEPEETTTGEEPPFPRREGITDLSSVWPTSDAFLLVNRSLRGFVGSATAVASTVADTTERVAQSPFDTLRSLSDMDFSQEPTISETLTAMQAQRQVQEQSADFYASYLRSLLGGYTRYIRNLSTQYDHFTYEVEATSMVGFGRAPPDMAITGSRGATVNAEFEINGRFEFGVAQAFKGMCASFMESNGFYGNAAAVLARRNLGAVLSTDIVMGGQEVYVGAVMEGTAQGPFVMLFDIRGNEVLAQDFGERARGRRTSLASMIQEALAIRLGR